MINFSEKILRNCILKVASLEHNRLSLESLHTSIEMP